MPVGFRENRKMTVIRKCVNMMVEWQDDNTCVR